MGKINSNKLLAELRQFTGSERVFYNPLFPRYRYTEGVKYLAAEAGAYWLLDHIFAHQTQDALKSQNFQVWKISVKESQSARIAVEDGNDKVLSVFQLGYTDFPLAEFSLWFIDGILLLPSEY